MNQRRKLKFLGIVFTLPLILLFWQAVSVSGLINPALFPPPTEVIRAFVAMVASGELPKDILVSLERVFVGFALGATCGIIFGVITGRNHFFNYTLGQIIQILRPIPSIAIVPLAIVWFGIGETSKYFLVFWGVFFPVWMNTHLGVLQVEEKYIWAAKSLGANRSTIFNEIIIPHAVPMIVAGMRTGIAIGFVCLVAAEMSGAFGGVGYRIYSSHLVFRVDKMMVGIITLGLLGAIADRCFTLLVERCFPWYKQKQT